MKILRVIASVDPATGGPVTGLRAITPALEKMGHQTEFLTVDDPAEDFLQSFVAPVHAMGPAQGSYSYSVRLHRWLSRNATRFDAIVVHGLWQDLGRTVRRVSRQANNPPYFVFPHGMLDPSLRKTYPYKHIKKWLYWVAVENRVLRDAAAVFFTCEEERRLAGKTFPHYHCNERVVAYGTTAPPEVASESQRPWVERCPGVASKKYILFLGRIHSKKGVDLLVRAYARLINDASATGGADLPELVFAGPCLDATFLSSLQNLAAKSGAASKIHWTGMITGDAKWAALKGAEAFILPSYQENFGIAVAEALAVGTPVLLSNRVNIWRELVADNAALVEPPTEDGTLHLLERWIQLDLPARRAMAAAAKKSFQARFEVTHAARNLADELSALIRGPKSSG